MAPEPRKLNSSLSLLVYGESKAGKSLLAISGKAPRLLLDCESAAQLLPINAIVWDPSGPPPQYDGTWDTAVVQVTQFDQAAKAIDWLHRNPHPFNSIAVDSISELQYKFVEAKGAKMDWDGWGEILRLLRTFCNRLRDMTQHPRFPVNSVVVTSMARQGVKDNIWRPWLQGQMGNVLPYLFDINGFLEKKLVVKGNQAVLTRLLHTEEVYPKTFVAGGRISGRIPSPFELRVVTGSSIAEISKNNITVPQMINAAFAMRLDSMTAPAPVAVALAPEIEPEKESLK